MLPIPVFLFGESPWTEEPGRLQSMGSQRAGHDSVTKHSTAHTYIASADALKSLAAAVVPCFLFSFHFTSISYKKRCVMSSQQVQGGLQDFFVHYL